MATVDVHRCVITKACGVPYNYIRCANGEIHISAWTSALLVQTIIGNPEPQSVGRVTKVPRFFRVNMLRVYGKDQY